MLCLGGPLGRLEELAQADAMTWKEIADLPIFPTGLATRHGRP